MPTKRQRRKNQTTRIEAVLPTPEQMRELTRGFTVHTESNTKADGYRRQSPLTKWIKDEEQAIESGALLPEGRLFPVPAQNFILHCLTLWERAGEPRLIAQYGERIASGRGGDGMRQQEAKDALRAYRKLLGKYQDHYWPVFENVAWRGMAAGVAGSQFASNTAQQQQSAKMITSMVAIQLAERLGY